MPIQHSPVDASIIRCKHTGEFTCQDTRELVRFLNNIAGKKLLIELSDEGTQDCVRELHYLRPLMPQTAVYGAKLPTGIFDLPSNVTYYLKEVRWFPTEAEALAWLREEVHELA